MSAPAKLSYNVFSSSKLTRLMRSDLRNIMRDPTLFAVLIFSIMPMILFFFFSPWMDRAAYDAFGLEKISQYAAPIFFILPAHLIGWVIGFLILEEKDEGALLALEVTPVGKTGIVLYRSALAFLMVFALALVSASLLFSDVSPRSWIILSLFISLQAVMVTLILPAQAKNKVQGLALIKAINLFAMAPLLAIIASPFRYLSGLFPGFWIGEYLALSSISYIPASIGLFIGFLIHLLIVFLFYRLLLSRTG